MRNFKNILTLGRTCKFIPPPWNKGVGGGGGGGGWGWAGFWMEARPGVFDMLQYYEAILPLVESL